MIEHLGAFLGISALVIATPGPDTALTIRNTLAGGRAAGLATALGVAAGQAMWTLATSAGLSAVLIASAPAFAIVRFAGALVLVVLGVRVLIGALRGDAGEARRITMPSPLAPGAALRQGVISNLANPKMAVFFTSLLPQFAGRGASPFASLLVLGLVFCTMTLVWLVLYAATIARAGARLRRSRVRRVLEGVMGAVLVAFGLRLATERR